MPRHQQNHNCSRVARFETMSSRPKGRGHHQVDGGDHGNRVTLRGMDYPLTTSLVPVAIVAALSMPRRLPPNLAAASGRPNREPAFLDQEFHRAPKACLFQKRLGFECPASFRCYEFGAHVRLPMFAIP